MPFNQSSLDALCAWCRDSFELAAERREARDRFFGANDPRPVEYWPGAEDLDSRERRFLGYFAFDWRLSTGERPIDAAIARLEGAGARQEALAAADGARFVVALVGTSYKRNVYLELGDERFEVRHPAWAAVLVRGTMVAAHLVPTPHGHWLVGPGWVNLPFRVGQGMRENLNAMQFLPVELEQMLQSRSSSEAPDRPEPPHDETLRDAVERMTNWAREHGREGLALPEEAWIAMVLPHLADLAAPRFFQDVLALAGDLDSRDDANEVVGMASNIWNNTPQPDRGGLSATDIIRDSR